MIMDNLKIKGNASIYCKSCFYSVSDYLKDDYEYRFTKGVNKLVGEIDSGVWAISYLLSMYKKNSLDFILYEELNIDVDGKKIPLSEFLKISCYLDKSYPLFSSKKTVKQLVSRGLKLNKRKETTDDIRNLFEMADFRFERPLCEVGHEIFKGMAAIGYCYGKEVFCFPWLSNMRFEAFHGHMTKTLEVLESLEKIVILPMGRG